MRRSLPTYAPATSSSSSSSSSWFTRLHQAHERLKRSVHEGMRVPLPAAGRRAMGVVYFITPMIGGYYVMQWAIGKSHASIGVHGEFLPNRDQAVGAGYATPVERVSSLGVPLAASDEATQVRNRAKLERFLQQQLKPQKLAGSSAKVKQRQVPTKDA